jgi:hypothetical protein
LIIHIKNNMLEIMPSDNSTFYGIDIKEKKGRGREHE